MNQNDSTTPGGKNFIHGKPLDDILFLLVAVAALFGLKITTFLFGLQHYVFPVEAGGLQGGLLVISHWSSSVLGIPLALIGAAFYVLVLVLAGMWFQTRHRSIKLLVLIITGVGAGNALGMAIWQPVVIGATCPFCMQSHMITGAILFLSVGACFVHGRPLFSDINNSPLSARVLVLPLLVFAILIAVFMGWWEASPEGLFATEYETTE